MVKIIQLAICHKCHNKIANEQAYTRYRDSIYHESCFVEFLDDFNLSEFIESDIMVKDDDESTSNIT